MYQFSECIRSLDSDLRNISEALDAYPVGDDEALQAVLCPMYDALQSTRDCLKAIQDSLGSLR